ncbi:MAG TPA: hypothetical protein VEJ67_08980 [Candidatus Cybelea sp.]|nr:hypothetical protein [Candidatus Cybelea sp.]
MSPETEHRPRREEGYERRDANVRGLLQFALWMAAFLVLVMFGMKWTFNHLYALSPPGPSPTGFERPRTQPPEPRLQVHPHRDLKSFCDEQLKMLNSYGWVDQQKSVVHIPIERAMDKLLEQGLPARPAGEISANEVVEAAKAPEFTVRTPQPTGVGGQCAFVAQPSDAGSSR